jgi:hypothetical protein
MTVTAGCPSGRALRLTRRAPAPPLRLTRRGRIVAVLVLVLVAVGLAAFAASPGEAAAPAGPFATAVVRPDDTLWSIAVRTEPGRDPFRVIDEIRRLNGIADYTVQPGERLLLPRRR